MAKGLVTGGKAGLEDTKGSEGPQGIEEPEGTVGAAGLEGTVGTAEPEDTKRTSRPELEWSTGPISFVAIGERPRRTVFSHVTKRLGGGHGWYVPVSGRWKPSKPLRWAYANIGSCGIAGDEAGDYRTPRHEAGTGWTKGDKAGAGRMVGGEQRAAGASFQLEELSHPGQFWAAWLPQAQVREMWPFLGKESGT